MVPRGFERFSLRCVSNQLEDLTFTSLEWKPMVLIATLCAPMRVALSRLVARRGMTALVCFDGAAAVAAGRAQSGELRGAILDADLPTMSGPDVARALEDEVGPLPTFFLAPPSVPLLFNPSGISDDELAQIDAWLARLALAPSLERRRVSEPALALEDVGI
jgi:hypothetical protein